MPTLTHSPTSPQPFDVLDSCHQQVLAALQQMAQLLDHLSTHGVDGQARVSARKIYLFFNDTARQHHMDEERHVFPALLDSSDDALVQQVLRLQQDHGWIEEDWLELAPQFESIAAGYHWHNPDQLAQAIPVFTALYRDHIALEESMIYPQAKARIDGDALLGMGREMAARRRLSSAA